MTSRMFALLGTVAGGLAVCLLALQPGLGAQQMVAIDDDDIGRGGERAGRAGGGRLGDSRDHGPADPVQPHGGHRRRGPLRRAGPAGRDLRRLGARLRARRFAQTAGVAGGARRSDGCAGARRAGRCTVLPLGLLVLPARGAGARRVPGHRSRRQRHLAERAEPGGLAARPEVRRVHRLPWPREQGHARDSVRARRVRLARGGLGPPHQVGPGRRQHEHRAGPDGAPPRARDVRRLDPAASWPARCRLRRRGPRGRSATSSSPSGTGRIPRPTCTTRRRPTSATRR